MYNVSHAFSASSSGVSVGSGTVGSASFVGVSTKPVMALGGGGATSMDVLTLVGKAHWRFLRKCLVLLNSKTLSQHTLIQLCTRLGTTL